MRKRTKTQFRRKLKGKWTGRQPTHTVGEHLDQLSRETEFIRLRLEKVEEGLASAEAGGVGWRAWRKDVDEEQVRERKLVDQLDHGLKKTEDAVSKLDNLRSVDDTRLRALEDQFRELLEAHAARLEKLEAEDTAEVEGLTQTFKDQAARLSQLEQLHNGLLVWRNAHDTKQDAEQKGADQLYYHLRMRIENLEKEANGEGPKSPWQNDVDRQLKQLGGQLDALVKHIGLVDGVKREPERNTKTVPLHDRSGHVAVETSISAPGEMFFTISLRKGDGRTVALGIDAARALRSAIGELLGYDREG